MGSGGGGGGGGGGMRGFRGEKKDSFVPQKDVRYWEWCRTKVCGVGG